MQASVDRIDGGVAILITTGENPAKITLPAALLPEGSREGDIVSVAITPDPDATLEAKSCTSRAIERLKGR